MKRLHPFLVVTGLFGVAANLLAIFGYLAGTRDLGGWHPDPGLVAALTLVLLAYGLTVWATLTWRWTEARADAAASRRTAMLLLNGLAAFPLLTFWLNLVFSVVLYPDVPTPLRWLLAMLHAGLATPIVALASTAVAEAIGPLLTRA